MLNFFSCQIFGGFRGKSKAGVFQLYDYKDPQNKMKLLCGAPFVRSISIYQFVYIKKM